MPLSFEIDQEHDAVIVTATEIVTRNEIMEHLRAIGKAGVSSYSQLFNALDVQLDLSFQDLAKIAKEARTFMKGVPTPKLAVVTDSFYVQLWQKCMEV